MTPTEHRTRTGLFQGLPCGGPFCVKEFPFLCRITQNIYVSSHSTISPDIDKNNDMTNQDLFLVFALLSAVGVSAVAAVILDYKSKVKRIQSEIDSYWVNESLSALSVLRRIDSILNGGI